MWDFNVFDVYGLEVYGRRLESIDRRLISPDDNNRKLWGMSKPVPTPSPTLMPTMGKAYATSFGIYFRYTFSEKDILTSVESLLSTMYENMVNDNPLPTTSSFNGARVKPEFFAFTGYFDPLVLTTGEDYIPETSYYGYFPPTPTDDYPPTYYPTLTLDPTLDPTTAPTTAPTKAPTYNPTYVPTSLPSLNPTTEDEPLYVLYNYFSSSTCSGTSSDIYGYPTSKCKDLYQNGTRYSGMYHCKNGIPSYSTYSSDDCSGSPEDTINFNTEW